MIWLWACSSSPCEGLCADAFAMQKLCVEERGLSLEEVGYESESDFKNACETWIWELELLDETSSCTTMNQAIQQQSGDDFDAAWSLP
jgi:hypothetical protein